MTHDPNWHVDSLLMLPQAEQTAWQNSLSIQQVRALKHDWAFWARPKQLVPAQGDWTIALWLAGRGFGKTRALIEALRFFVDYGYRRIALVARTAADVRDVLVEGPSGVMNVFPPEQLPLYEPSKRRITFRNGAVATTYTADKPDQLRGPEHDLAICDEIAAWRYRDGWDNLMMGLRLGEHPICLGATTPRPTPLIRELVAEPGVRVIKGHTYDNAANLAPSYLRYLKRRYENTRLGRQELAAELLDDTPGALWTRAIIEKYRVSSRPAMRRIVVAVDPAVSSGEDAAETGIIAVGLGVDGDLYVLDDASIRDTPQKWAKAAVDLMKNVQGDRLVGEANNGGEMVEATIRTVDPNIPYTAVHASRGKATRAEPVSALYEQGRVHHDGMFAELEDQMTTWIPGTGKSPDRVDALVWAIYELVLKEEENTTAYVIEASNVYSGRR